MVPPPDPTGPDPVPPLVDHLFRTEYTRLVAFLTRRLGAERLGVAEDVASEALLAALKHWPQSGVPDNPGAWLVEVARRKAIDLFRRDRVSARMETALQTELIALLEDAAPAHAGSDPLADDQLRLIFLCCHPTLPRISRVALTLKIASGLSVREIGRAFLSDEIAIAQRLARARKLLREIHAPVELPPASEIAHMRSSGGGKLRLQWFAIRGQNDAIHYDTFPCFGDHFCNLHFSFDRPCPALGRR